MAQTLLKGFLVKKVTALADIETILYEMRNIVESAPLPHMRIWCAGKWKGSLTKLQQTSSRDRQKHQSLMWQQAKSAGE